MSNEPVKSPFVAGARVAVRYGYNSEWREDFVDKVYKTGRFTLRGSKKQWRPYRDGTAGMAGDRRWSSAEARIWNAEIESEIRAATDLSNRRRRLYAIQDRIRIARAEWFTNAQLDAIEAALPEKKS